jgi:hypothetical protein
MSYLSLHTTQFKRDRVLKLILNDFNLALGVRWSDADPLPFRHPLNVYLIVEKETPG